MLTLAHSDNVLKYPIISKLVCPFDDRLVVTIIAHYHEKVGAQLTSIPRREYHSWVCKDHLSRSSLGHINRYDSYGIVKVNGIDRLLLEDFVDMACTFCGLPSC